MANKLPKLLTVIFLLALLLRIIKLGTFPVGFHADEVRVAWNALSILKTGKDDRGNILSLHYNTFGDYRPTGIFYATIPSLILFGKNEFAVRFPSAIFGAATVFPLYLLTLIITKNKKTALFTSFLLSISPWHIEVSRATSEVVISTFFALYGLYFLIRSFSEKTKKFLIRSFCFFVISYLFYHTIRVLAPIFIGITIVFYWKSIKMNLRKKIIIFSGSIFLLTSIFTLIPGSRQRASQVSIFNDVDVNYQYQRLIKEKIGQPKIILITARFIKEYGTYFTTDFLTGEKAKPFRYTTPGVGLLTFAEIFLVVVGIVQVIREKKNPLPLFLLFVSPIPAALTTEDTPNLHRAFLMLPFLMIIASYGFESIKIKWIKKISTIFLIISFFYFLFMYFHTQIHRPFLNTLDLDNPSYRDIGAKELALKIYRLRSQYDKVIVTNYPDEIYPYYAFFNNLDPKEFNQYAIKRTNGTWQYQNVIFPQLRCPSDDSFSRDNTPRLLIIDAGYPACAYPTKIKDGLPIQVKEKILRPDGSEVYALLERSPEWQPLRK